jgi:hypothetical protein
MLAPLRAPDLEGLLLVTGEALGLISNAAKKPIPIESIKRVTGQRSNGIELGDVAPRRWMTTCSRLASWESA